MKPLDLPDVAAVDDRVDGEREAEPRHLGGEPHLGLVRAAQPRDLVGGGDVDALQRELHVVEPGIGKGR